MITTSYANTIEADDYLEYDQNAQDWFNLTDDEREALLIQASRQLERLRHRYNPATSTQALKFPVVTYNAELGDGLTQAKEACILQALHLLRHQDELIEAERNRIQGIKAESVGALTQSSTGFNPLATISPQALQILAPFIDLSVRQVR